MFYIIIIIISVNFISNAQSNSSISKGTTIITVIRNDTVWIGADSKETTSWGNTIVCKIIRKPSFVFAHAGISGLRSDKEGLKNINIIEFALNHSTGNSLQKIMNNFNKNFTYIFTRLIMKTKAYSNYSVRDTISNFITSVIFANYESRQANVFCFDYIPIIVKNDSVEIKINYNSRTGRIGGGFHSALSGERDIIEPIINKYSTSNIPEAINLLINKEIKAVPQIVGLPINIIRIDKAGIHWIQKNQPCK